MKNRITALDEPCVPRSEIGDTRTIVASAGDSLTEVLAQRGCPLLYEVIDSYGAGISLEPLSIAAPVAPPTMPSCVTAEFSAKDRRERAYLSRVEHALQAVSVRFSAEFPQGEFGKILNGLTTREWDVLLGVLEGQSCKQISHELDIGFQTVAKHKAHLFQKLHVKTVAELITLLWSQVIVAEHPGLPTAE